jgi:Tol biopolymer transport system component
MTLVAGTKLGPYEILSPLGAGGMGEVYKAKDTRLDRTVAVKVLPSHMSASAEVRQRFEREAKTISQLSHPHICALYDVGHEGDTEYLVMEYLEGDTLAHRIDFRAIALDQCLRFATDIAGALDAAHRRGIVHRDLKPSNVMVTKTGVKLLDFGLAKVMIPSTQASSLTAMPTQDGLTQEGTILGTFQYMAPEQLEGKDADGRTDIFAFGALVYEMTTGKKAFPASSQASLITAIMSTEPPAISSLVPMAPPALDRVVRKCLSKDPEDRWQSAGDLASELKWIVESGSQAGIAAPVISRRRRREGLAWTAAFLLAVGGAILGVGLLRRPGTAQAGAVHAVIPLPERLDPEGGVFPELSPDGQTIVLAFDLDEKTPLWLRPLGSAKARPVPGSEGAAFPFWSPDGRSLGYFKDKKLMRIDAGGGTATPITEADGGRGATWNRDGTIVFAGGRNAGLSRVSATGGSAEPLTRPDAGRGDASHRWPYFLPDGRHLLYFATSNTVASGAIYFASVDGKENRLLVENALNAAFSAGRLIFVRKDALFAQPFDPERGRLEGQPTLVVEGVNANFSGTSRAMFSVSANGTLVFVPKPPVRRSTLVWLDRAGKRSEAVAGALAYTVAELSPDQKRVAVGIFDANADQADLWIIDLVRGNRSRLTFGSGSAWSPVWSPDSTRVAYARLGPKGEEIYVRDASGAGSEELLLDASSIGADLSLTDWSPDGNALAFTVWRPKAGSNFDVWILPLSGERKAHALLETKADEVLSRFSPDGKWIAYQSNESGRNEIYAQPYPGPGGKVQVSTEGGASPGWPRKGRELFFVSPDARLMAAEVQTRPAWEAASARPVFADLNLPDFQCGDYTPDGQHLLACATLPQANVGGLRLILNWPAELKK